MLNALIDVSVPYHLDIAGDGEESYIAELKNIVSRNNIQHKISWLGFHNENKFELIHQHDLLILPSYDENFGNVVIESLSVGTPVLITPAAADPTLAQTIVLVPLPPLPTQ